MSPPIELEPVPRGGRRLPTAGAVRWLAAVALAAALVAGAMLWLLRPGQDVAAAPELAGLEPPVEVERADLRSPAAIEPVERAEVARAEPLAGPLGDVDEPPTEEIEEAGLPDPVELGPAKLDLRLLDARSGEPVASHVGLWRLDAPGNQDWTEGDQLQQQAHVPAEGFVFSRLPQGRYRLVCDAQAWDTPAPEVDVVAPLTRLDVRIDVPATFGLRVVVRDRFGRLVPTMLLGEEDTERLSLHEPWRFERMPRNGDAVFVDEDYSADATFLTSSDGPQTEEGFDLGRYGGATRGWPRIRTLMLQMPDGGRVRVRVPARAEGDLRLVAVAVPADVVATGVFAPDGAPVSAEVEVWGEAIEADPALPGGGWDRAPVRIRARLAGYRPVSLSWSVAQGDLPRIVLEPDR